MHPKTVKEAAPAAELLQVGEHVPDAASGFELGTGRVFDSRRLDEGLGAPEIAPSSEEEGNWETSIVSKGSFFLKYLNRFPPPHPPLPLAAQGEREALVPTLVTPN